MIRFHDVTKVYATRGLRKTVADHLTLTLPSDRSIALLGRNGAGKSTFLRLIAGTMRPTSGHIEIDGRVSWPVGFAGTFHPELTGLQNARFVARVYGVDTDELTELVRQVADIGAHFHQPVRTYSTGMRARLAFAISMGIDFDTYLIDEVTSVGDQAFRNRCEAMLNERLQGRGAIVVAHNLQVLRRLCDYGVVLEDGQARLFEDIDEAIATHEENMAA